MKTRYTVDQIISKSEYGHLMDEATRNIVKRLRSHSVFVGIEHERIIKELCAVIINQWKDEDHIIVHPGACGFGKTTALLELVKIMTAADSGLGIVIAVERISDMMQMVQELGSTAIPYFSFYAEECLQGLLEYDRTACKGCQKFCLKKKARKEHANYQVLLVTHEFMRMRTVYGEDFGELAYFNDENGVEHRRSLLLIDEKPQIALNQILTDEGLSRIRDFLITLDNGSSLYNEACQLEQYVQRINMILNDMKDGFEIVEPLNCDFKLSDDMKKHYFQIFDDDNISVLGLCSSIISKGGVVKYKSYKNRWGGTGKIFTADMLHPSFRMKTVIFDATAVLDWDYFDERYLILDTPQIRDFTNLTLNNNTDINLSRSKLWSNKKPIEPRALLSDVLTDYTGQMLLLTYKDKEDEFKSILNEWQNGSFRCNVNHFGNVKGDNQYADADRVILYGLNRRPDEYYVAKALSYGIRVNNDAYPHTNENGRVYRDERLQEICESEMAAELIQSIMRAKLRKQTNEPVEVYSFIQSSRLMQILQEHLSGCSIKDWIPFTFCLSHSDNKTIKGKRIFELIRYLERKFKDAEIGTSVDKNEIKQEISKVIEKQLSKNSIGTDCKNDLVQKALDQYGVIVENKKLTKIERSWSYDNYQKKVC